MSFIDLEIERLRADPRATETPARPGLLARGAKRMCCPLAVVFVLAWVAGTAWAGCRINQALPTFFALCDQITHADSKHDWGRIHEIHLLLAKLERFTNGRAANR
jgi:hypothetical protein